MSRSTLNQHLGKLEGLGLIERERRFDEDTKQRKTTFYILRLDIINRPDVDMPCPETGQGAMSGKRRIPCPENAESHVRNPDTNLVREHRKGTGKNARARARQCVDILREIGIEKKTAVEFVKHRAAVRSPMTVVAAKRIAMKLRGNPDAEEMLWQSIENGWRGVFPVGRRFDRKITDDRNDPTIQAIAIAARSRPSSGVDWGPGGGNSSQLLEIPAVKNGRDRDQAELDECT
jgi:DNA-binding transcriptional ArsR family regulator